MDIYLVLNLFWETNSITISMNKKINKKLDHLLMKWWEQKKQWTNDTNLVIFKNGLFGKIKDLMDWLNQTTKNLMSKKLTSFI